MRGQRLLDQAIDRLATARSRIKRIERRELWEFRRWLQNTDNLLHLSIVLFVPVVIGFVTYLSNQVQTLSFLLFPPLASGTYTLFSDPDGRHADPVRFVASLSIGAICGLISYTATAWVYDGVGSALVHPESAALAIFLTGLVTWAGHIEAPSAFSTALLALVTGDVEPVTYVVSVFLAAVFVAGAFVVWRETFYEKRAEYLYETVRGDDHVLVPMRGETAERTALFGARLAAAHEAGKVVLLDVVSEAETASADGGVSTFEDSRRIHEVAPFDDDTEEVAAAPKVAAETRETVERLERCASDIHTRVGVPCEVVVVAGDSVSATIEAGQNANCDLVVTPYEEDRGTLSRYIRGIFASRFDAVAFRSVRDRVRWSRVLVLVARPGDVAHGMIDFASRLTGDSGTVSVTTCIGSEVERRTAETHLDHLVETVEGNVETRVSRSPVQDFIAANADDYDLLVIGSSGERSPASRFVSPPTFERVQDLECDVAVFDRGNL
ncbi:HPP family protein [Halobellus clavatus]|uniref:Universal stress protein family protein n=1 Tax=Halobellus clavatus TaxID=660517 RepID=A0A1H3F4W9_9EURY|nr:HPP family protein [Halobellus clavatus]SDX86031.1 Universal stress protein family protein [Halobellus clavatus]